MAKHVVTSMSNQQSARNNRTIDVLAAETNKVHGQGTVVRASDMVAKPARLSTGSLWYDLALGGGWPSNAWSEIVGLESSGKTAVATRTLAIAMQRNPDFTALWCAAEPFDLEYATAIGVDPDRLYILEENTMEIVYDTVVSYVEERSVDMAVIDAYPSLVTDAEDTAFIGDSQVSPGARLTGKFMRQGTKATKRSLVDATDRPFTGLFINQWRNKVGVVYGDPRTTPGGVGKNFWFASRVEIRREDWINDADKFQVGQSIKMNVFKNKSAAPKKEGLCDFYFDDYDGHTLGEFDTAGEVIQLSQFYGVISRPGKFFIHNEQKIASTKVELETNIRSDPEFCRQLEAEIRHKELGTPMPVRKPTPIRERRQRPGSVKAA